MRVLVFGGAGFVGSRVCHRLRRDGDQVVAVDHAKPQAATAALLRGVEFVPIAVHHRAAVAALVRDTAPDAIINLAYIAGPASEQQHHFASEVNVLGPINCMDAALATGVGRYVYASSIGVYGPTQSYYGDRAITENDGCELRHHTRSYGATKALNDFMAQKYSATTGLATCGVRLSIVFGPGRANGFTTWTSAVTEGPARNQEVLLPYPRSQMSSLISVDDAAAILVEAARAHHTGHAVYNSGGHTRSMADLAALVSRIEPDARFSFDEQAGPQPFVHSVCGSAAKRELGFELSDLEATLRAQMDAVRSSDGLTPKYARDH